jgi:hypothetical protein
MLSTVSWYPGKNAFLKNGAQNLWSETGEACVRVWADDPFLLEKWQTDNREQKLHLQAAKWCSGEVGDGLSFAQSA